MRNKSVVTEAAEIQLSIDLIRHGARLQVLEAETQLSRERLLRLYKEVKGESPPKGMLPFSADWFVTWMPNIHASLFVGFHRFLATHAGVTGVDGVLKAYKLYLEHCEVNQLEAVLTLTRAWMLNRFIEGRLLTTTPCSQCNGHFVVHALELYDGYVCGLCKLPSRAGKTRKARASDRAECQPA